MSTSDTSGSSAAFRRRYLAGIRARTSATGTSGSGSENATRPGDDSSKISLSYWGIAMSGDRPTERVGERVDLVSRPLLGHRHEQGVLQGPVELPERHPGEDPIAQQPLDHPLGRLRELERELLEAGRAEAEPHAGDPGEPLRGVVRLRRRALPRPHQPLLAQRGRVDRGHEGAEADVRADVRRRLLAPDVLLA